MKKIDYVEPKFHENGFNCPHCGAFAHQEWDCIVSDREFAFHSSSCAKCGKFSLWKYKRVVGYFSEGAGSIESMIYPQKLTAPMPSEDMPAEVKEFYDEAREVSALSPRAAAALLRVSLEKLTEYLGEKEGDLSTRIGNLKKQGLPKRVIQSLDIVRITANEGGSHAGEIDLTGKDNAEIVGRLFRLVNFIVEKTITDNKEIKGMLHALPENKKEGIKNRDKINDNEI